ncbi:MAG: class I SAM-dependent methyltransferase [Acidimicrobiales bacterium]
MATLPPQGSEIHEHRQIAESFGSDAERYDRTRPHYPDQMIERITASSSGSDLLCAGCGTGIDARQFAAAGMTVLGVEPDERMADFARSTGIEVEVSAFEHWEPRGRLFDVVAAGQAWHWIDPVKGASKASEVLKPGGRLAAFWNVHHLPQTVSDAFSEVFRRVVPESPFNAPSADARGGYSLFISRASEGVEIAGGFTDPQQWRFDWEKVYSKNEWLEQLPTQGTLTRASSEQVERISDAVGAAIDELGGSFTIGYTTELFTAVKSAD